MEPTGGTDTNEGNSTGTTAGNVKVKEEPGEGGTPPPLPPPPAAKPTDPDQGSALSDFAETTMNELLGWYGYDKVVDREDTQGLNLQRFTSRSSPGGPGSHGAHRPRTPTPSDSHRDSVSNGSCDSDVRASSAPSPGSGSEIAAHHQTLVTALTSSKSPTSSTSPNSQHSAEQSPTTVPAGYIVCAWCQKPGLKLFTLKTDTGTSKVFCSELCFTQCRRASFKKNKVCDWCKHVRHTVNYVDFQDGEQQLQFCSDKCLNQYKMNIFCKETQEHLQMIQGGQNETPADGGEKGSTAGNSNGNLAAAATPSGTPGNHTNQILITPDLWMANGDGEHGSGRRGSHKRKRRMSSSCEEMDMDDLDDLEEGDRSRDSDESSQVDSSLTEVKPDITKMTLKTEVVPHQSMKSMDRDREREKDRSRERERHHSVGSEVIGRRHIKIDHAARERLRRVRSRDSACTPLAVTTSPTSSQMSTTPPSAAATLTPPNGLPVPIGPGGAPMMAAGALPPGMHLAPPHYFYPHLMAGGFPGLPPHAAAAAAAAAASAWMLPAPPGYPGHGPPPGLDPQSRHKTTEGSPTGSGAQTTATGNSGDVNANVPSSSPSSSSSSPPPSSTATGQPQPSQAACKPGAVGPPAGPLPHIQMPPGFPYPMGAMPPGGLPPGFPMPIPPGFHPAMMPPQPPHHPVPGPHPTLPGGPPVTVMVPYPVLLPVPVPIPIPIPIRCNKDLRDLALIMKTSHNSTNPNTNSTPSTPSSSFTNHHHHSHHHSHKPTRSSSNPSSSCPRPASVPPPPKSCSSSPALCPERRRCRTEEEKENSVSAANCDTLGTISIIGNNGKDKIACACCQQTTPSSSMDSHPPNLRSDTSSSTSSLSSSSCKVLNGLAMADLQGLRGGGFASHSLESDHGSKNSICNTLASQNMEDMAIDLSKDKSGSNNNNSGKNGGLCLSNCSPSSSSSIDPLLMSQHGLQSSPNNARTPPATITVKSEAPPLIISPLQPVGGFLMPPRDHAYSSRRSMILDAPSVPRDRNKSPSPEKRLMLRSPNRDVMFAKRRCMRTRIKTK